MRAMICEGMGRGEGAVVVVVMLLYLILLALKVNGDTSAYKPGEPKTKHCKADSYSDDGWWSHCSGEIKCPNDCPDCHLSCKFCGMSYCPKCNKVGSICQDPRFIGGDGVMFYFHGRKDSDYCIVSDTNLHINAHFIGKRPAGRPRDFTWVQSLGILFHTHKLYIGARKTSTWDPTSDRFLVYLDGESVILPQRKGSTWQSPPAGDAQQPSETVKFTRLEATNSLTVAIAGLMNATVAIVPISREESRVHRYELPRDDCMAHLEVTLEFGQLSDRVSGVLGQTYAPHWQTPVKPNLPMPTFGQEDKYVTSAILTPDCFVSQFKGIKIPAPAKNSGSGLPKMTGTQ